MIEKNNPPLAMPCPKKWPYGKKWEKQIESNIGWEAVEDACDVYGAAREIKNLLITNGPGMMEKVVEQNQIIKRILNKNLDYKRISRMDVDWQGGNTWERNLDKIEIIVSTYGIDNAQTEITEAIDYIKKFSADGANQAKELIEHIYKVKQEIEEIEQMKIDEENNKNAFEKWDRIDIDHSTIKEGFIYALENSIMPGVLKVGFTSHSPDKRAQQISEQYNLPSPFVAIKYWRTKDPYIVEQKIHQELKNAQKGGEFFFIDINELDLIVIKHILP